MRVSHSIPIELTLEILCRLPAKSIARFHCVSKSWASILGRPYFKELFVTKSSAQPRVLFAIEEHGLWTIFSLPQRQSPYEKSSSSPSSLVVAAKFHMKFPPDNMRIYPRDDRRFAFGYASGLFYFYGMCIKQEDYDGVPVICNPITGRYGTLPFIYRYRKSYSFFGFDPIGKQFKVLFMAYPYCYDHHKIMTLGSGETRWRRIKCPLRHENVSEGICINGVLYYLGDTSEEMCCPFPFVIVCFDVRSEEFNFIYSEIFCELINYNGKLGVILYDDYAGDTIELRVRVLEDMAKQEWSEYAYTLRDDKFLPHYVSVVGVTVTGEIVLSMADYTSKQPFYVFYFNPEKNTLQRVEVQGFGEYHESLGKPSRVHVFVDDCSRFYSFADHVEDLNVNDSKLLKSCIYAPYVVTEEKRQVEISDSESEYEYEEEYEEEEGEDGDDEYEEEYEEEEGKDEYEEELEEEEGEDGDDH